VPGATPLLPNNGRIIQNGSVRVLCVADVRGKETLTRAGNVPRDQASTSD
jgi:hypothetical protein